MLVILGDDMATSREAIAHVIQETHKLEVLQADDAAHVLDLCRSLSPALVRLEVLMPGLDSFAAAAEIKQTWPNAKVGILTRHNQITLFHRARQARLNGFVLKRDGTDELHYAIRTMLKGGFYAPPSMASADPMQDDPLNCLTERERSVFTLYAQGSVAKDIAQVLDISVKTTGAL